MNSKLEYRIARLEKLVKEMFYADEYICDDCGSNPSEFFSTTINTRQDGEDVPLSICSKCVDDDITRYYADEPVDSYDDFYKWVDESGLVYEGKRDQEILNNFLGDDYYNKYQLIKNKIKDPEYKDIYKMIKMDPDEVKDYIDNFQSNTDIRRSDKKGATKLYEDNEWIVYRITTYPAAQLYGKNTRWCITGRYPGHEGRGEEYFNNYIKNKDLDGGYYFYINKQDPSIKYCVLQTNDKNIHSIWDAKDTDKGSSYKDIVNEDNIELPEVREVNLPKPDNIEAIMIFKAIRDKDMDKVKSLLDRGIDPNIKDNNGDTPLYIASLRFCEDVVNIFLIIKLLLENGADPNIKNSELNTPLHSASESDSSYIAEWLLKYGANPNVKNNYGDTPLHYAYVDMAELLLKNGADPNIRNNSGHTPLHNASSKDIAELLLKNGANPNIKDKDGNTPLHSASTHYRKSIVELLLKNGANPNVKNNYGNTPLYYASEKGYKNIVELLLKYGAEY